MNVKEKLNTLNGFQRVFVVLSGCYFVFLLVAYSELFSEVKSSWNKAQSEGVMRLFDYFSPLPKREKEPVNIHEVLSRQVNRFEGKPEPPIEFYTPARSGVGLLMHEKEEIAKDGYQRVFQRLISQNKKYDLSREIKEMEDARKEWHYFLYLSLPGLLLVWLIPTGLTYAGALVMIWIFRGFKLKHKKNDEFTRY